MEISPTVALALAALIATSSKLAVLSLAASSITLRVSRQAASSLELLRVFSFSSCLFLTSSLSIERISTLALSSD